MSRMDWWREAKFGIFIHWGPYAQLGGRYQDQAIPFGTEWIRHTARIPREDYAALAMAWNPTGYDPHAWATLIAEAGARYTVLTTKHHDGFCLWDTATTEFRLPATSFARDAVAEFATAVRAQGLRLGWYYSPRDWHHPHFLPRYEILGHDTEGRQVLGFAASDLTGPHDAPDGSPRSALPWVDAPAPAGGRDLARYHADLRTHLTELTTRYGLVDVLWFDGQDVLPTHFPADAIVDQLRAVNPDMIINDRLGTPPWTADFGIHENVIPESGETRDWESCDTMNYTWGYGEDWTEWFPPRKFIHDLCDVVSKGGNYLLNIGPDGDGRIPDSCADRLREIGRWLSRYGEAIYGTRRVLHAPTLPGVRFTQRGDHLYVLQLDAVGSDLWLPGLSLDPGGEAIDLGTGRPVRTENTPTRGLRIRVAELPLASWVNEPALALRLRGARWTGFERLPT